MVPHDPTRIFAVNHDGRASDTRGSRRPPMAWQHGPGRKSFETFSGYPALVWLGAEPRLPQAGRTSLGAARMHPAPFNTPEVQVEYTTRQREASCPPPVGPNSR